MTALRSPRFRLDRAVRTDRRRSSALGLAVGTGMLALALSGCVPGGDADSDATPAPSGSPTPSAAPSETAKPEPTEPGATTVDVPCDELLSAQQVYDFNPNFVLVDTAPAAGSPAAEAVAAGGVACTWQNGTSGETIVLSVSAPGPAQLEAVSASAPGEPTDMYGDAGWFALEGYVGTMTVLDGEYRVTAQSEYITTPAEAAVFLEPTLSALP